eukprot:scaffold122938_cov36-Phaeocystis_antarctica.AAC.1
MSQGAATCKHRAGNGLRRPWARARAARKSIMMLTFWHTSACGGVQATVRRQPVGQASAGQWARSLSFCHARTAS